jgi:RNA polymerase sigma-70 factor (ECF subfamily)
MLQSHELKAAYIRYRHGLIARIQVSVGSAQVAEELLQDTFLKAYRARDQYDPRYAVTTWLWNIARNTIIDYFRRAGTFRDAPLLEEPVSPLPGPEDRLLGREAARALFGRRNELTHPQRRVLWLRLARGYTFEEIAARMDMTLPAVKNLRLRALATLLKNRPACRTPRRTPE